jgi:hypothetical protein
MAWRRILWTRSSNATAVRSHPYHLLPIAHTPFSRSPRPSDFQRSRLPRLPAHPSRQLTRRTSIHLPSCDGRADGALGGLGRWQCGGPRNRRREGKSGQEGREEQRTSTRNSVGCSSIILDMAQERHLPGTRGRTSARVRMLHIPSQLY